ncbi:hypothetical protein H2198_004348 [Neophaeococcomyces mojaviensis]|uniref:Uncharacterized protein n=1 Tax=Neophaeococcomyces mojaviensis TaxID=3383035 RepID=A0ACC3A8P9_9EURO|nr:hypothetical protein H2198_004348 [Knufia sp. JES_112]
MGLISPARSRSSSTCGSNAPSRGDDVRRAISAPFDFQHITHTEQSQFAGLGRIEESELAQQFSFITTEQTAAPELKGIEVSSPPAKATSHHCAGGPEASPGASESKPTSPLNSSRPLPPLKDGSPTLTVSQRNPILSTLHSAAIRSPEPPQLLQLALASDIDLSLFSVTTDSPDRGHTTPFSTANGSAQCLDTKPLPDLPVIHAVTTEDDSAMAMKATPLPTLPGVSLPGSEAETMQNRLPHQRQHSSLALRHMSFYPTAKTSMPNLVAGTHRSASSKNLPRYHSDMALSEQARNSSTMSSIRASMSFGAIDTMNWEDAVDEAWDDVNDLHEPVAFEQQDTYSPRSTFGSMTFYQPVTADDAISTTSTPLMMAPHRRISHTEVVEAHQLQCVNEGDGEGGLAGLAISTCPLSGTSMNLAPLSRSSSLHPSKRQSSLGYSTAGNLTRSSSQESIILSIASSIIGTQRSSSSSMSADDLSSISKVQEDAERNPHLGQDQTYEEVHVARPESGCLPLDVIEQLCKMETVSSVLEEKEDEMPAAQPLPMHQYKTSISKVIVPERKSSVVACEPSRFGRRRASTTQAATRPRETSRVSYSLFPVSQPVPPPKL